MSLRRGFQTLKALKNKIKKILFLVLTCSSTKIKKDIMAPRISSGKQKTNRLNQKKDKVEMILNKVRKHVESNFDYVGDKFADEARAIHYGEKEEREIYGETSIDDAVELIEEGINVEPLPGINPKLKN
jgi:hypothetical protein